MVEKRKRDTRRKRKGKRYIEKRGSERKREVNKMKMMNKKIPSQ